METRSKAIDLRFMALRKVAPLSNTPDVVQVIELGYHTLGTAFRGRIRFADLFGEEIFVTRITIQDQVQAGTVGIWIGQIDYNQFTDSHRNLRNTELEDMQIEWLPSSIIFTDGTELGESND